MTYSIDELAEINDWLSGKCLAIWAELTAKSRYVPYLRFSCGGLKCPTILDGAFTHTNWQIYSLAAGRRRKDVSGQNIRDVLESTAKEFLAKLYREFLESKADGICFILAGMCEFDGSSALKSYCAFQNGILPNMR